MAQFFKDSLRYYRNLKNVTDTDFDEGRKGVVCNAIHEGLSGELIAKLTGLDVETIRNLRPRYLTVF